MNTDSQAPADLTPLAWVQEEVRRTLEGVNKALRRQLREFELRQAGGQLDAKLTSAGLQAQAHQLHQIAGVLHLVELPEGRRLVQAAETLLRRCADSGVLQAVHVDATERAGFALLTYATRLVAGARPSPLALFPTYRVLQELNQAGRIHPADFWPQQFEWRTLPPPELLDDELPPLSALRTAFEMALLRQMREASSTHAAHLAELCASLGVALGGEPQQSFWQLAAAHFDAQAQGMLASDQLVKRMASRLLAQLRNHMQGRPDVADRLVQDLLFFCAQSGEPAPGQAPRLRAVRVAYGLDEAPVGDYRDDSLGRIDPAQVLLARRRVAAAKDAWSAVADGDTARAGALDEASSALTESLTQLFANGELLGQTLQRAAVVTLRSGARPPATLGMEVATSLLYVEAALDDGEYDNPDEKERVSRLALRVQGAATGQPAEPLESWMEDLFRRVADRQTLGSVMQELRVNLGEVERHADEYFRDPSQRQHLIPVPGQLQAMRGVFAVLGLNEAATTCVRMRDEVDRLSNTEVNPSLEGPRAAFERLANNLGQLGFLIDMLSVQAPLAKSMFHFDEAKGELVANIERERPAKSNQVRAGEAQARADEAQLAREAAAKAAATAAHNLSRTQAPVAVSDVVAPSLPLQQAEQPKASAPLVSSFGDIELPDLELPDLELPDLGDTSLQSTEPMSLDGHAQTEPMGLESLDAAKAPVTEPSLDFATLDLALSEPAPAPEVPSPAPGPAAVAPDEEDLDQEMLEIFMEEANEVVATARAALDLLGSDPRDRNQLTTVRRAFHTLKGSGRMVGLNAFGEAAWACEQLYNARISDETPADAALLDFSNDALDELAAWRDDIVAGTAQGRTPTALVQRADALRTRQSIPPQGVQAPTDELVESIELDFGSLDVEVVEPVVPEEEAIDLSLDLSLDLAAPEPAAVDFGTTQPLQLDSEALELDESSIDSALAPVDFDFEEPVVESGEAFDIDLSFPEAAEPLPSEELPALELQLEVAGESIEPEAAEPAVELPVVLTIDDEALDLGSEVLATDAGPQAGEPASAEAEKGEAFIQVGNLQVSEALFRIYTTEAEGQSEKLVTALQDWAGLHDEAPPSATEVYAHALAGNAATVGFASLSQLARALEHALGRAQQARRIHKAEADLFVTGAVQIRELLAEFVQQRLGQADSTLVHALEAYQPVALAEAEDSQISAPIDLDAQPVPAIASVHAPTAMLEPDFPTGEPDQIDEELWEIFEEEAGELLQQLHGRLRDWTSHPQDASRGDACMRTLHTFKGGARLAGAMHLGELAHRLESDVLTLLSRADRQAADVHPLQDRGDELEARFENLRQEQRQAGAAVAAPQAVVKPVAAAPVQEPVAEAPRLVEPAPIVLPQPVRVRLPSEVAWAKFSGHEARELTVADAAPLVSANAMVRVRSALLDRLAAQSGEVSIRRARMENELNQMKTALLELDDNLERLRTQLRELEVQAEAQISSRQEAAKSRGSDFDPLEFDRYTRFQEVTRMLAESVNDVATVQRSLQRNVAAGEDELAAQARLTRELQDDLLSSRMVEFESIGERLHRVVRQAAREGGKQVQLEIQGQGIELDRGVLERLIGAFEHLLRNSVVHGIEGPEQRKAAGKAELGTIRIKLSQEGNQVLIAFSDDGAGLNLKRIREKAVAQGLMDADSQVPDNDLVQMIYAPGFSTASEVTEMAGRGVGMDVVRAEVTTLGGYVMTRTQAGKGTEFDLRVPLTTALTHVVILRVGELRVAVPASLVDMVLRMPNAELSKAYETGQVRSGGASLPVYWLGGLLAHSDHPVLHGKHAAVVVVHSGPDRIAIHVDEVLGNQEVVVKNLGPQLIHVPGLAGISLLANGGVALIYNLVALAERYGTAALARAHAHGVAVIAPTPEQQALAPLIMVVDDSLTVRRVSQRFLEREGFRVQLAKDGLDAIEQLAREDLPDLVLSDIEMPRMDGFDLVRNIRADARLKSLPVVMITSRIAEKHREYAQAIGVQGYLGKPYDEETLLRLIRQYTSQPVNA
jgi:chemosensory pili system protein ChpA (sensor histidine kinase/response regulator)